MIKTITVIKNMYCIIMSGVLSSTLHPVKGKVLSLHILHFSNLAVEISKAA